MEVRLLALRRRPEGILFVWEPGGERLAGARELRLACPCARCVHEVDGRRLIDPAAVPDAIAVRDMQPAGRYGYRILFDDGHDSGIYPLELLAGLGSGAVEGGGR
jgi:ATP-binding protein involved in chromosome partitioning